jgi:peptide/nickel transport system substrate-binding protein
MTTGSGFTAGIRHLALSATMALALGATPLTASAQTEKPQYGGTLSLGMVYVTLSPLSWDPTDWPWKYAQDAGLMHESLMAADLSKSKRRGGKYAFTADSWLPTDATRGELAESWKWLENPPRVEFKLRKGIMFPDKPGIMKSREFVAQDVVANHNRMDKSPKKLPTVYDHIEKVEATDKHTVVFTFKNYFAEWDYRSGWGYNASIVPQEIFDAAGGNGAKDWKNHVGTGPFQLTDYVQSNSVTYTKNPIYWDKEQIGGQQYKLPFADKRHLPHHQATSRRSSTGAAHRQARRARGRRWSAVEELKKNAPAPQMGRWLNTGGTFLAMRTDTKPFTDVRVRRAMNMAVNKQEIVSRLLWRQCRGVRLSAASRTTAAISSRCRRCRIDQGALRLQPGQGQEAAGRGGIPERASPSRSRSARVRPTTWTCCRWCPAYLEKVGVKIEIQPMEYGAFLSAMTTASTHIRPATS